MKPEDALREAAAEKTRWPCFDELVHELALALHALRLDMEVEAFECPHAEDAGCECEVKELALMEKALAARRRVLGLEKP